MKKILSCCLFILCFIAVHEVFAQKDIDLQLELLEPIDGSVYNAGDTMFIEIRIINHGPEDIQLEDTFRIANNETFVPMLITNVEIPASTNFDFLIGVTIYAPEEDESISRCYYILSQANVGFLDDIQDNDTTCFTVTFKGSTTSIDENLKETVMVYPNPMSDVLNIDLGGWNSKEVIITIYDLLGKKIYQKATKHQERVSIQTDMWSTGIYILDIEGHKERRRVKVQKE